jgi:hypothetical protein
VTNRAVLGDQVAKEGVAGAGTDGDS